MSALIRPRIFAASIVVTVCQAFSTNADLLTNGGFESPILPPDSYLRFDSGNEPPGWQITMGDVDIIHLPLPSQNIHYSAFAGNQVLDLNGSTRGAIRQDFSTNAGQRYVLRLAFANNPRGGVSSANVILSDVGSSATLFNHPISRATYSAPFVRSEGFFIAAGPLTRLEFASTSPDGGSAGGIFIDHVSISIPEPSSLVLAVGLMICVIQFGRNRTR
jgi:hypothetical protein